MTIVFSGLGATDERMAFALVYTALVLAFQEYFLSYTAVKRHGWLNGIGTDSHDLATGLVWVASAVVFFVVIPANVVRIRHREPLASISWNTRGLYQDVPVRGERSHSPHPRS